MICFIRYIGSIGKTFGTFTAGSPKNIFGSDISSANYLKLTIKDYQKYLIDHFNARKIYNYDIKKEFVYFIKHNDLVKALEWIESVSIVNKLRG